MAQALRGLLDGAVAARVEACGSTCSTSSSSSSSPSPATRRRTSASSSASTRSSIGTSRVAHVEHQRHAARDDRAARWARPCRCPTVTSAPSLARPARFASSTTRAAVSRASRRSVHRRWSRRAPRRRDGRPHGAQALPLLHHADRRAGLLEPRGLLDVQLEVRAHGPVGDRQRTRQAEARELGAERRAVVRGLGQRVVQGERAAVDAGAGGGEGEARALLVGPRDEHQRRHRAAPRRRPACAGSRRRSARRGARRSGRRWAACRGGCRRTPPGAPARCRRARRTGCRHVALGPVAGGLDPADEELLPLPVGVGEGHAARPAGGVAPTSARAIRRSQSRSPSAAQAGGPGRVAGLHAAASIASSTVGSKGGSALRCPPGPRRPRSAPASAVGPPTHRRDGRDEPAAGDPGGPARLRAPAATPSTRRIAAAAVLCVTEPMSTGLGGDAFACVWRGGELAGLDAAGPAPAVVDAVEPVAERGPRSVTVPGAVAGWDALSRRYGRLGLDACLRDAIDIAERGFSVAPMTAAAWGSGAGASTSWAVAQRAAGVRARAAGRRSACASRSSRRRCGGWPRRGRRRSTAGPIARAICEASWLEESDLAAYEARWVEPLRTRYGAFEVAELPPPTQGIVALQALALLDELEPTLANQVRCVQLALEDAGGQVRDGADVAGLLEAEHLAALRARTAAGVGEPGGGTVYLCTADGEGTAVSFIQSLFANFGSGVVAPGTGIVLQSRGACFARTGAVEPGRRPYHTIIPGMLLRDGGLAGAFGIMGGFIQAQAHVQFVSAVADDGLDPQAALDRPRFRVEPRRGVPGGGPLGARGGARARRDPHAPATATRSASAAGRRSWSRTACWWAGPTRARTATWRGCDGRARGLGRHAGRRARRRATAPRWWCRTTTSRLSYADARRRRGGDGRRAARASASARATASRSRCRAGRRSSSCCWPSPRSAPAPRRSTRPTRESEFAFYLEDLRPRLLRAAARRPRAARAPRPATTCPWPTSSIRAGPGAARSRARRASRRRPRAPAPDDVALLLHTSGTTSRPKQVPLSHRNLLASARSIARHYALGPDDVSYCAMPLFHVHGIVASTLAPLVSGGTVVAPRRVAPSRFWPALGKAGVTWYSASPTFHEMLLDGAPDEVPDGAAAALRPLLQRRHPARARRPPGGVPRRADAGGLRHDRGEPRDGRQPAAAGAARAGLGRRPDRHGDRHRRRRRRLAAAGPAGRGRDPRARA